MRKDKNKKKNGVMGRTTQTVFFFMDQIFQKHRGQQAYG
jgi:hypothetical protein